MSLDTLRSEACARAWPEGAALSCPHCGEETKSLKQYPLCNRVVFLLVAASWRGATHTACPRCMRKQLRRTTLLNLAPANVLWPVVFLVHAALFAATWKKGHSRGVIRDLRVD
jgi:hypothetical protein